MQCCPIIGWEMHHYLDIGGRGLFRDVSPAIRGPNRVFGVRRSSDRIAATTAPYLALRSFIAAHHSRFRRVTGKINARPLGDVHFQLSCLGRDGNASGGPHSEADNLSRPPASVQLNVRNGIVI